MNEILISIIVPAYNEEQTIEKSLLNLLKVLKKNNFVFEILIINDGSTDTTKLKAKYMLYCL